MASPPLLVPALAACALVHGSGPGDPEDLDRADLLVRTRAEEGRLEEALVLLRRLSEETPGDPRVQGRLSWALYLRDEAAPPGTGHRWEEGVGVAWACLAAAPAFATALDRHRGRITDEVAARIQADRAPCLLGLVAGWSRRVQSADPLAMAIDLEPLRALADRAVALDPLRATESRRLAARVRLLVPPELGGDRAEGAALLEAACGSAPDPGCLLDLAVLAYDPGDARRVGALEAAAAEPAGPEPADVARARSLARDLLGIPPAGD